MNKLSIALLAMAGVGTIVPAPAHAATSLFGTFFNEVLPNGDLSYTFAAVSTSDGSVSSPFDFTVSGRGISGLAFDPNSGLFAALTVDGRVLNINAATHSVTEHTISGLPTAPYTNFQGIEYDPTQLAGQRMLVTYGQNSNQNLQNQIAAIDPMTGVVSNYTGALAIADGDALVFNLITNQLIVADTNNPPFVVISDVFGTPTYSNYANASDSELYDPACSDDGTIYFSRRATLDLWRLSGNSFVRVGPHNTPTGTFATGLAFGTVPGPGTVSLMLVGGLSLCRRHRVVRGSSSAR